MAGRKWAEHPLVVAISVIAALATIVSFLGWPSLRAIFGSKSPKPTAIPGNSSVPQIARDQPVSSTALAPIHISQNHGLRGTFHFATAEGRGFSDALDVCPTTNAPGLIQIKAPPGAKRFVGKVIWNTDEPCGGEGNGAYMIVPQGDTTRRITIDQHDKRLQDLKIDLSQASASDTIDITVDPRADRVCDQVAIADGFFQFK